MTSEETSVSMSSFSQETSMHGLKYAATDHRRMRRLFWCAAVILTGAALIYMICSQLVMFFSYPIMTKYTTGEAESLEFPAVTICNLNGINTKHFTPDPKLRNYLYNTGKLSIITEDINWNNSFYNWALDEDFMRSVANDLNTLIYIAYWQGNAINVTEYFTARMTPNGVCYTFNDLTKDTDKTEAEKTRIVGNLAGLVLSLNIEQQYYYYGRFNMAAGVKVVLHDPRDEPDVMSFGFTLSPGYTSYVSIKHQMSSYLEWPYKAFKDGYCVKTDSDNFQNPLKYFQSYSQYACLRECELYFMLERCGCRTFDLPGNATVCNLRVARECAIPTNEEFHLNPTHKAVCDCPKPCKRKHYKTELSLAYFPADGVQEYWVRQTNVRNNFLEFRLYYQELEYDHMIQIPEYTLEGIVANLGGQMGLFLGASVLTITELLEFFALRIINIAKKLTSRSTQTRVEVIRDKR